MSVVQCLTRTVFVVLMSMPLQPELAFSKDGFCYRHDAPNGAVRPSQHSVQPKTAKKARNAPNTGKMNGLQRNPP